MKARRVLSIFMFILMMLSILLFFQEEAEAQTVDFIIIRDSPGDGGNIVLNMTYSVYQVDLYYAAAYNVSSGYIGNVEAEWVCNDTSVGQVTTPGIWTNFTAQWVNVDRVCFVTATYQGSISNTTGTLTVLAPRTDYNQIRSAPGGGGINLSDPANYLVVPVGYTDTFYGASYNYTVGYIGDVPATTTWSSNVTNVVTVTSPGSSSTITCSDTNWGTATITMDDGSGHQNTTQVTVMEPTVDFILIRTAPGGGGINLCNPANYPTYPMGHTTTFYGAEYNLTAGYIGSVPATTTWSSNATNIVDVTSPGSSSTITCSNTNSGVAIITIYDGSHQNTTVVTVSGPGVDYILIRSAPGGGGINLSDPANYPTYPMGHITTFYGASYNNTSGYIGDVLPTTTWNSTAPNIVDVTSPGSSSTITCSDTNWGTATITMDDGFGHQAITQVTVMAPEVDYVQIRSGPGGSGIDLGDPANYPTYPMGYITTFYSAAYNFTFGYIGDITTTWNSTAPNIVDVTSPGSSSTITCSNTNSGVAIITIDDGSGHQNTTQVTVVMVPQVDYILIRSGPNGTGINLCDPANYPTYPIGHSTTFFGAVYNNTYGHLGDVNPSSTWNTDDPSIVNVSSPGSYSDISCSMTNWGTATITLDDGDGHTNTTNVTVMAPTLDYYMLTDAPNGEELTEVTLAPAEIITAYASGYNYTGPTYINLIVVDWDEYMGLGSLNNLTGTSSTFTAGSAGGWTLIEAFNFTVYPYWDNFTVHIINETVDFIQIRSASQGLGYNVTNLVLVIGQQFTLWAAAYNYSAGYLGDFTYTYWTETSGGSVIIVTSPGASTTVQAQFIGGVSTITADYLGVQNTTNVTVLPPSLDYIEITDKPNGVALITVNLGFYEQFTAYASGYNYTGPTYVDLVEVNWSGPGGVWNPEIGTNSTFTAGNVSGKYRQTAENSTLGLSDGFDIYIGQYNLDYISLTNEPNGYNLTITALDIGQQKLVYASGYNYTHGYIGLVNVSWSESAGLGSFDNYTGTSTTFTAGYVGGWTTITGEEPTGMNDTFNVYINPPTVDFIFLTYSPGGTEIPDVSWNLGDPLLIYASGFNHTGPNSTPTFGDLVYVAWYDSPILGYFDNTTGTSSTYTGTSAGLTTIWGGNSTINDTFQLNILPTTVTIDSMIITDSPNGTELSNVTLPVGGEILAYASGYNDTSGYVDLVIVDWSESAGLGSFNNLSGSSSTFTAGFIGGSTTILGENKAWGLNDTFNVTIIPPTVNYITLTDAPNGTEFSTVVLNVGQNVLAYASSYNTTSGYIGLLEVNWSESVPLALGSFDNQTGTSTTFTAGFIGGSTIIQGENLTLGKIDTFNITINPPTVDFILIRTQPGGGGINLCDPVNYRSYPVGASDSFYGAGYNSTADYIGDVPPTSNWTSSNPSVVTVTSLGNSATISCSNTNWGVAIITLDDGQGHQNTTEVTVIEPTVDYIHIRDEPYGFGSIVGDRTYIVWEEEEFYAASYNNTADYLGEVEAQWSSTDTSVGTVTTPGLSTTFTAQKVDFDSVCQVAASYNGITDSTGVLTVLAPRMDYITIIDSPDENGEWVADRTYNEGENDTYWSAVYNTTSGFIELVESTWESNNTIVGIVTPGPGEYTDFTAGWRGGFCRVKATYNSFENYTGIIYVINFNQLPTSRPNHYNGTGFVGGDLSFSMKITLRVTGRKKNIITMELEEDGIVVKDVAVTRHSGEPDIGIITYDMDVHKVYDVVLTYDGHNGGSNPLIVTFEFLGKIYSVHMLFNSQHGENQKARIAVNDVLQLVGAVFFDGSYSSDFEGYIVDYDWDFGDGTQGNGETVAHTYSENGVYTVTLIVTDDEGGTDQKTIPVYVENIDNNNQVNAILGSNASKGYMNASGQYVVILECPADLLISNPQNLQIGLLNGSQIKEIEGAFIAKLYSDIEVYFIPIDDSYTIEVDGTGSGLYNLSVIGVSDDFLNKYGVFDVTCSENTLDIYILDFIEDEFSISTNEDDKLYSLEFLALFEDDLDSFNLKDMDLNKTEVHIYKINDWGDLSSGKPVTLYVDEEGDGLRDKSVDLQSGLSGDEVDALLIKHPMKEPVFPFLLLFIIASVFVVVGLGGLLTEVGKWALLSLFIPLYSRIKKEKLLDQPIRFKIHGYIIGNPGAHFGLIKQDLQIPNGQLVYHLKRLMQAKMIYSKEDGIRKRFYPVDFPKLKIEEYYLSDTEEKILGIIEKKSGISQKEVATQMGISRQVAGYHLAKMEQIDVIKKEIVGRESRYYPNNKSNT
ncbi:MAG: PKD domain-containing protein [Thermoplasmata archaeon]|nr:MAG: PKD domain-containing protein [Thermoplasmata archaeon]